MVKHLILAGVAALSVAVATSPGWAAEAGAAGSAAAASKPQLGSWGVDTQGMDKNVRPGESFFEYVNGNWARTTEIPADKSSWGGFGMLRDLSDQRTRAIIEEAAASRGAPGSNARKVGDFYASFMDEAAIEAKGAEPLKPYFAKIEAIRSSADLGRAFGEAARMGIDVPIGPQVEQDLKDNSRYTVYVGQGGLGLPDRDYYL
ncbi:MAG TPA: M13 family metallopeptidase N-terminal domain-containing protein, partial [Allosphingosinicella sp.]